MGIGLRLPKEIFVGRTGHPLNDGSVRRQSGKHEMDVRVNQARQNGAARKIKALAAAGGRLEQALLDAFDAPAADADQRTHHRWSAGAIPKAIGGDQKRIHMIMMV